MIKDLLPWKKSKETEVPVRSNDDALSDLHSRMNSLFDSFFDDFDNASWLPSKLSEKFSDLTPKIEVSETEDAFEVNAELPGMDADDLDVSIDGNILTIKGEKKEEREDKKKNFHIMERRYGSFSRSLYIPVENLDLDKIESKFKKGVLKLKMAKTAEAKSQKRKIEITS
jgi:HSP20 family protein